MTTSPPNGWLWVARSLPTTELPSMIPRFPSAPTGMQLVHTEA
eukprot:CAMPEP_0205938682 /NCGR_PEP_ID=MMETSP1325-20131115/47587_1 /ASSEMBLY_ACC=CAM_ASM_000708 /TAXON_ID=236786 /ORGANISM="Florenciella sp., Strain RCC1007" /LENGTH=42 /DNA_ID= /DNA_START= /DNA_END= /DNA_ORIENTATION=